MEIESKKHIQGKNINSEYLLKELKKANKKLEIEKERHKKVEKTLGVLLNNISDAIIVHDLHGKILYVNKVMLEMYGVEKENVRDLSIVRDLSAQDNPVTELEKIWKTVLAGEVKNIEWKAKRPKDGREFMVEVVLCKIIFDGKNSILATIHNISKSKQIEEDLINQKVFLQSMIDNLPVGLFVKRADSFEYILWNKTSEKIFGVSVQEAIGKTAYDIFPKKYAEFSTSKDKEAIKTHKIINIKEHIFVNQDNQSIYLHSKKLPLFDEKNNPQYIICITEDITNRKKSEQSINRDIHKASLVQQSILTNKDSYNKIENLEIDVQYLPMNKKIGGDYYHIQRSEDGVVNVIIADIAGHGIQAALSTMQIDLLFRESLLFPLPYQRLKLINSLLFHELFSYNFFTCFIMNIYEYQIQYASAGHPSQFLFKKRSNTIKELQVKGRLLGADEHSIFESAVEEIESGDIIMLFTDGLYEVFNSEEEEFGLTRLKKFLLHNMDTNANGKNFFDMSVKEINQLILGKIYQYQGGKHSFDDISLVTIRIK